MCWRGSSAHRLGQTLAGCDDAALQSSSRELGAHAREDGPATARAFALAREAAARVLGLRAYEVQIHAALALDRGNVVEMQTGEGKTLAAVLPAYHRALLGRGVHVLTFNDYLARRDAEWMGPVYRFLGLDVGLVQSEMTSTWNRRASSARPRPGRMWSVTIRSASNWACNWPARGTLASRPARPC